MVTTRKAKQESAPDVVSITKIRTGMYELYLLGRSPYICNAMGEKARHELLLPRGRLTSAEKQTHLKHDPIAEFHASAYQFAGEDVPTRVFLPGSSFKKAAMSAALDIGGITKAAIGRLMWIEPIEVPLYGVPKLRMVVTRSSDINRTPDIRTRATLVQWACRITVNFVQPNLGITAVTNLINAAGLIAGVGDWRQQKGSGSHGQFEIVNRDDPRLRAVIEGGGRVAQDAALAIPTCYDVETERLFAWFQTEAKRRDKLPTVVDTVEHDGEGDAAEVPAEALR